MKGSDSLLRAALASTGTVLVALQKTCLRITIPDAGSTTGDSVLSATGGRGLSVVFDITLGCELGLDGGGVDAVGMEATSHLSGKTHVTLRSFALDLRVYLQVN